MQADVGDWRDPDYGAIYEERSERLKSIRSLAPDALAKVHDYYAKNPIDWIEDWTHTWDPRRLEDGLPALRPFMLFDRQKDLIRFWHGCNIDRCDGVVEKTREVGVSWCAVAYAVWMWIYKPGSVVGFGSFEAVKVDRLGVTDSLLEKCRVIIRHLPPEMLPPGLNTKAHGDLLEKRLLNPSNGAQIIGEVGDNIGRGGRASMYFVDEYAFLKHHEMIDGALSNTSDCKQYISTAYGMGAFFAKTQNPTFRQFRFEWRQDPRKDDAWYEAFAKKWGPIITAREVDIDHAASIENVVIEARYVEAAKQIRGLLSRKGVTVPPFTHYTRGVSGLDVGGGAAPSVFVARHGPYVSMPKAWTDQHGDTTITGQRALRYARQARTQRLNFDAPAVGAGVASTLRHSKPEDRALEPVAMEQPVTVASPEETVEERIQRELYGAFGNAEEDFLVATPGAAPAEVVTASGINTGSPASDWVRWPDGRTSNESFVNLRAEIWWIMRDRFQKTYETWLFLKGDPEGTMHPIDELIFLPDCPELTKELSLLTWHEKPGGKIGIESKKDAAKRGIASPDYADALGLTYVPARATARSQKLKGYF